MTDVFDSAKVSDLAEDFLKGHSVLSMTKETLDIMKKRITTLFTQMKAEYVENLLDFDGLVHEGIIVKEKVRKDYSFEPSALEFLKERGVIHLCVKAPAQFDKMFDVEDYIIEPELEDYNLRVDSAYWKEQREFPVFQQAFALTEQSVENSSMEELLENYMRIQKQYKEMHKRLEMQRSELQSHFVLAARANQDLSIPFLGLGKPKIQYDYLSMLGVMDTQTMDLAVSMDGSIVVRLQGTKNVLLQDVTLNDFDSHEEIKKRFGGKRLQELTDLLGEGFYYVSASRMVELLSLMEIATSKLEPLYLNRVFTPQEFLAHRNPVPDKVTSYVEIVTEEDDALRFEMYRKKEMHKLLTISGYYDIQREKRMQELEASSLPQESQDSAIEEFQAD